MQDHHDGNCNKTTRKESAKWQKKEGVSCKKLTWNRSLLKLATMQRVARWQECHQLHLYTI
jgi:hypothetical protein